MIYLFMTFTYTQLLSLYITHFLISLKINNSPKQDVALFVLVVFLFTVFLLAFWQPFLINLS